MKVITKQSAITHFKDVHPGQVFIYTDEEAYMRLDSIYRCYDEDGYERETWSAVHLESGELCEFDGLMEVRIPHKVIPMEISY